MCGLVGLIPERAKRSQRELDLLTDTFTRLLLLSEHRGPHATGTASIHEDGDIVVAKKPLPARMFVNSAEYLSWMNSIDRQTTYLMGHTRWPTKGSIHNPANNHPLVAEIEGGYVALSHNGTIRDSDLHFRRLGLPRTAQVDSELLMRLAQRHSGNDGLDIDAFVSYLPVLRGRMSAALVTTTRPNQIILLKGNMPLEVRFDPKHRVISYASEPGILDYALRGGSWERIPMCAGEGLVVDSHDISANRNLRFGFGGIDDGACSVADMA